MTIILFILTAISLWGVAGTATYRRVGALVMLKDAHTDRCAEYTAKGNEFAMCVDCGKYRSIIEQFGHHDDDCKRNNVKVGRGKYGTVERTPLENPPVAKWTKRDCVCRPEQQQRDRLMRARTASYAGWPVYIGAYLYINGHKAFLNSKGDDWSFFIEPRMVQTKAERLASLDQAIARAEQALADTNREIKELGV